MRNPYRALSVKQTIDLLVTLADGSLEWQYRTKVARTRLFEHLRAIAADKPKGRRR